MASDIRSERSGRFKRVILFIRDNLVRARRSPCASSCYNFRMLQRVNRMLQSIHVPIKDLRTADPNALLRLGGALLLFAMFLGLGACSKYEAHFYGKAAGAQRVGNYPQAVELY